MRHEPGRAVVGLLTLALGVAAVVVGSTTLRQVVLTPLPVRDQDELVLVWNRSPERGFAHVPLSADAFDALRDGVSTLSGMGGVQSSGAAPTVVGEPDDGLVLQRVWVMGDFFGTLGALPAQGRLLTEADDRVGAEAVAVIARSVWTQTFGADPGAIGSTLHMDGRDYRVVGVAPDGFAIPEGTQVWATFRGGVPDWDTNRPVGVELDVVGRLAAGATPSTVADDVRATLLAAPAFQDRREFVARLVPVVTPLPEFVFGSLSPILRLVMATALVVYVVAIANLVLLLMAGHEGPARDAAVRRALGAEGVRAVEPVLFEAALLATLGGTLGLAAAGAALRALRPWVPTDLPWLADLGMGGIDVAVGIAATGAALVLAGALVAWAVSPAGKRGRSLLGATRRTSTGGGPRRFIAAAQIALTVTATVGAGLLGRTVQKISALDPGFDPQGISVVGLTHRYSFFAVPDSYRRALADVSARLEALPGIAVATPVLNPPVSTLGGLDVVPRLDGEAASAELSRPFVVVDAVLPGYFNDLGISIEAGRSFAPSDGEDAALVAVVSRDAARVLWPGVDPIGRQVAAVPGKPDDWATVVGVVADTRYRSYLDVRPALYFPLAQLRVAPVSNLLIRSDATAAPSLRASVNEAFADVDPSVSVLTITRLENLLARPRARPRFAAAVLGLFAAATLFLAALGTYGVFSLLVQERSRELALRRAFGARAPQLARLVARTVLVVAGTGAVVGLGLSVWAGRAIESLLFGVGPTDVATFGVVGVVTVAVAFLAGVPPMVRAATVDPMMVLRDG